MANGAHVLLLLGLVAVAVQAQTTKKADIKGTLEKNNFKLAAALFDIANLTEPLSNPAAVYTVLVPNDNAVETFLKKMGLTVDDLKKRPLLAKQLAAQHIIKKANVRPQELFANGPARIVATAAGKPNDLLFKRLKDGAVKVTDVQGQTANVKKPISIDEFKTAHPIDKVLMPDSVFYNFQHLCVFRPLTLKTFCQAVVYAGLNDTIHGDKVNLTVFVPNNKAFTEAIDLSGGNIPSVAKAADILKYHAIAGYRTLGYGLDTSLKNNVATPTLLPGQTLNVGYETVKPPAGDIRTLPYAKASVSTTSGQKVPVVKANVHVGTAIVHGVESVLLPGSATTGAKTAAAAATKPAGRRHLSAASRNLLDFGWGMMAGPTAEEDDAASAINNAVDGDESVAAADDQSLLGAEELSVPGDYSQVVNGINPW